MPDSIWGRYANWPDGPSGPVPSLEPPPPEGEGDYGDTPISPPAEADPKGNDLPLVWFGDLHPNLDTADFVEGLLTVGAMSVVYGESNCGKTFFMADLALHVALGRSWWGREVEKGGVIYCALEGAFGIANRVTAFRKHHGIDDDLPFAVIPTSINMLDPEADTGRLIKAIKQASAKIGMPISLVVIDTLSRALTGGNENGPEDMGALVSNTDRVRHATNAHVSYVHHSGKDAAKGARGHTLLRAATDTEIEVSRTDKTAPSIAKVTKQREMEITGEFIFKLEGVELGQNRRGKTVTSCVVVPATGIVGAEPKPKGKIDEEALTLLREIENIVAAGQAKMDRPMPGMPVVPTFQRSVLQVVLVQSGWLRLSTKLSSELSKTESATDSIPDSEHARLWKRLNHLKAKGKIGFNRIHVWLATT